MAYNLNYDQSNYVGWTYSGTSQRTLVGTSSNAKIQLESWYSSSITGANADKIADGMFCNDRNIGLPVTGWGSGYTTVWSLSGTPFAYATVDRVWNKHQPTLACNSGDTYTLKVGAITADELEFAGSKDEGNDSYYLYNGQYYWTMSPTRWSGSYDQVFIAHVNGSISNERVDSTTHGLRPVINLRSDITFSGGDGTLNNPYVVE